MALIDLPSPLAYPGYIDVSSGGLESAEDTIEVGEYWGVVFCASQDMTIGYVGFRASSPVAAPTALVTVETVGTDGFPSGLWAANTSGTSSTLTNGLWFGVNLTASASVTRGQMVCIKFAVNTGTSFAVGHVRFNDQVASLPYDVANTSGTPTKGRFRGFLEMGVGTSSSSLYPIRGLVPMSDSLGSGSFSNTDGSRRGLRFRIPFAARACGMRFNGWSAQGDFNAAIYDYDGNELSSSSTAYDTDHGALNSNGHVTVFFDNPVIILPDTLYRAVIEPTSATTCSLSNMEFPDDDHRSGSYGGTNNLYTTYTTTGGWSDVNTDTIPLLDVLFDQLDLGVPVRRGAQNPGNGMILRG